MARVRTWLLAALGVLSLASPALGQSGSLSGRVTSTDGPRPIASASVTVATPAGVQVARVTTSGDGRYRVPGLAAATYQVTVAAIGHQPKTESVQVGAGAAATLDVALELGITRIEDITLLLQSVLEARRRVMLEVNAPADKLEAIVALLPCMREATVSPLYGDAGFAVKAAVPRDQLARVIPAVKAAGGSDLVVTALNQIVP